MMQGYTYSTGTSAVWDASSPSVTVNWMSNTGSTASLESPMDPMTPPTSPRSRKVIGPKLYMSYVKSKMGKVQIKKMDARMKKLQHMIPCAKDMGQLGLFEALAMELSVLVTEAELVAYGLTQFISSEHIYKYKDRVKDNPVYFTQLEQFPRVIPEQVRKKLAKIKKANLFGEFWVLYLDYTGEKPLKTNKEKIREKDPILFGRIHKDDPNFYYIADWVDEYCDLTLDKMIDKIKLDDPEFKLGEIPELTENRFAAIVQGVRDRANRLSSTNRDNFKELMKEEDPKPEKKWWKFWRKK